MSGARARWLLVAVLALSGACRGADPALSTGGTREIHLRVLAIHDFHGALRPTAHSWSDGQRVGGAPALKTVMDRLAAECACPAVRIDGGDQMQGTLESNLTRGAATVAALNDLGLDAAAIGNHELDWGLDIFRERLAEARYAWLAANVFRRDTGARPDWATPYALVQRDGVTVGVVGYATVDTPNTLRPDVTAPYEFRAGYDGIREALDEVWQRTPDFVIVAAHADGDCTNDGCTGEMVDLAAGTPPGRIHLIVGGHRHAPGTGVVNGVPIVRAGSHARAVGLIDLHRREGTHTFRLAEVPVVAGAETPDAGLASLLEPYFEEADAIGAAPVTELADPLTAAPTGDRRLGYLVADTIRRVADADIGMQNPGGIRADLATGVVSYLDLHRVLPFDNTVVTLRLTGAQVRDVVEYAGVRYYFSNLHIAHDPEAPPGHRIVSIAFDDGTPLRDDRTYRFATNDFLADGGDGFDMLAPLPREVHGITLLDAVAEHLRTRPAPVTLPAVERVVVLQPR
jgi:2',3'-cyclic-nucleotide 2'-phosphodiesterase (5'-nucleotidase family)